MWLRCSGWRSRSQTFQSTEGLILRSAAWRMRALVFSHHPSQFLIIRGRPFQRVYLHWPWVSNQRIISAWMRNSSKQLTFFWPITAIPRALRPGKYANHVYCFNSQEFRALLASNCEISMIHVCCIESSMLTRSRHTKSTVLQSASAGFSRSNTESHD